MDIYREREIIIHYSNFTSSYFFSRVDRSFSNSSALRSTFLSLKDNIRQFLLDCSKLFRKRVYSSACSSLLCENYIYMINNTCGMHCGVMYINAVCSICHILSVSLFLVKVLKRISYKVYVIYSKAICILRKNLILAKF